MVKEINISGTIVEIGLDIVYIDRTGNDRNGNAKYRALVLDRHIVPSAPFCYSFTGLFPNERHAAIHIWRIHKDKYHERRETHV